MSLLIQQKQLESQFEFLRSQSLPYINGGEVVFSHNWSNFDPSNGYYQVEPWAICTQNQSGWVKGDLLLLNGRGATISVNSTSVILKTRINGINVVRRAGNDKEMNLNPSRWLVYVLGVRQL